MNSGSPSPSSNRIGILPVVPAWHRDCSSGLTGWKPCPYPHLRHPCLLGDLDTFKTVWKTAEIDCEGREEHGRTPQRTQRTQRNPNLNLALKRRIKLILTMCCISQCCGSLCALCALCGSTSDRCTCSSRRIGRFCHARWQGTRRKMWVRTRQDAYPTRQAGSLSH